MKKIEKLQVWYEDRQVGTLAETRDKKVAFEYTEEWLRNGFSISPFSLPLEKGVFVPTKSYFQGLFGVFADSLPDAWGNILVNRMLTQNGISLDAVTPLMRLAIVGESGMGALTYRPEYSMKQEIKHLSLDRLAMDCNKILQSKESDSLDELFCLGGTSGGARPKVMMRIEDEEWLIKFPAHFDVSECGKMEYDYSVCARKCGIPMTETRLFPSERCWGYFGTKRFDRVDGKRIHMITASALLELDFTIPSFDYHSLMKLTKILTRDSKMDVESMYRRMCFNVFAHNRDDHGKNFAFLYDEEQDMWKLSPAYDLTYSNTYFGEHTTFVDGNGVNPTVKNLLAVGVGAGLSRKRCSDVLEEVKRCVETDLKEYLEDSHGL